MDKKYNEINFVGYFNNKIDNEVVSKILTSNDIKSEKCDLFNDFVQSLIITIFDTYLGDSITPKKEQKNHFKWCWNKTILIFSKDGFLFESNELYNYYFEFITEVFYSNKEKQENNYTDNGILKVWSDIFNLNKDKTASEMDMLIEIYKIFNNSLNKQNNRK
jgi:hypothetical protein